MKKQDIDDLIKDIHDFTVDYVKKHPNRGINLERMNEIDEELRKKLYEINGLAGEQTK